MRAACVGLLGRGQEERERVVKLAGALQVSGQRQALGGGLTRQAGGGKGLDGRPARRERPVPLPLQLEGAGQPALGFGESLAARPRRGSRQRPPSQARTAAAQVSRPLRAGAELVKGGQPLALGAILWPELQGSLQGARRIAVGMHRARCLRGGQQRIAAPCSNSRPASQCSATIAAAAPRAANVGRHGAMEGPAAGPRHLAVDRLAGQGMAEDGLRPAPLRSGARARSAP